MLTKRAIPEFWATTIAKVLAGDQPCLLSPWHRGFHKWPKKPQKPEMALWNAKHTELLQDTVAKYRADGWGCRVEQFFKVEGSTAILSGKADLLCKKTDCRPLIIDVKTGEPRDSDVIQVLLEMVMIPLAWGAPTMQFNGSVIYASGSIVDVTPTDASEMAPKIFAMLKRLGTMPRPEASPGEMVCGFCDIPDGECPDRWKPTEALAPAMSLEF